MGTIKSSDKFVMGPLILLLAVSQWPFVVGNIDALVIRSIFYALATAYLLISVIASKNRSDFIGRLLTPPVLLFIFALVVSTIVSGNPQETLIGVDQQGDGSLVAFLLLVGALALVTNLRKINHNMLYLTGSAGVFLSLLLYLSTGAYLEGVRASGIMGQPVLFATMLAVGYIYGFHYRREIGLSTPAWTVFQAQLLLLIFSTMTRGVILPIILYTLYEIAVLLKARKDTKEALNWYKKHTLFVAVLGAILLGVFVLSGAASRTLNTNKFKYAVEFRGAMVTHAVSQADIVPLMGYGHEQIFTNMGVYKPFPEILEEKIVTGESDGLDSTHNIFVDFWLQYGLLGLVSFVWLMILALFRGSTNFTKSKKARFLTFALVILLLQALVNPAFPELKILLWLITFTLIFNFARPRRRRIGFQSWLAVGFSLFTVFVLAYNIDTARASHRLSRVIQFPLRTTQKAVERGSSYDGTTLAWAYTEKNNYHHSYQAVDIHVKPGTEVLAAVPGRVVFVRHSACGNGTFPIVIIHGYDNLYYLYSHLAEDSIPYYVDQPVSQGAVIGKVGDSGCSQNSAPHLHFDVSRVYEPHRGSLYSDFVMINAQAPLAQAFLDLPND